MSTSTLQHGDLETENCSRPDLKTWILTLFLESNLDPRSLISRKQRKHVCPHPTMHLHAKQMPSGICPKADLDDIHQNKFQYSSFAWRVHEKREVCVSFATRPFNHSQKIHFPHCCPPISNCPRDPLIPPDLSSWKRSGSLPEEGNSDWVLQSHTPTSHLTGKYPHANLLCQWVKESTCILHLLACSILSPPQAPRWPEG